MKKDTFGRTVLSRSEFYTELKKLKDLGWKLGEQGEIRVANDSAICPYLALPHGLDVESHDEIYRAADNAVGHNKKLRATMLKHLGLTEKEEVK